MICLNRKAREGALRDSVTTFKPLGDMSGVRASKNGFKLEQEPEART